MHWLLLTICLYTGLASARTEEDQQASSTGGVSNSSPVPCFYRPSTDCPNLDADRCPCKRITLPNAPEGNAALCCNTDSRTLEYGLSCIGESTHRANVVLPKLYVESYKFRNTASYYRSRRVSIAVIFYDWVCPRISLVEHKPHTHT